MNRAGSISFGRAGFLFLAWLWVVALATAGEPIVFATKKSQLPPVATEDLEAKVIKSLPKFSSTSPFDDLGTAPMPDNNRPPEGRRDKRGKKTDAQAQKWNWDEMQDEDQEDLTYESWRFEIEEDSASNTGVGSRLREISTTSALERDHEKKDARVPTHLMGSRQRQKVEGRAARGKQDDDGEPAETEVAAKAGAPDRGAGESGFDVKGARAEEREALTLSALVTGERTAGRNLERAESSTRRTLGSLPDAGGETSKETTLDSLRRSMDSSELTRLSGLFEPVNLQPDLGLKRMNPTLPESPRRSLEPRGGTDAGTGIDRGVVPLPDIFSRPAGMEVGLPSRQDSFSLKPPAPESIGPPKSFGVGGADIPRRGGVLGR